MTNSGKKYFSLRFLEWFCPPDLFEGIEGDLVEQFEQDIGMLGIRKARKKLLWAVIRFFRPGIILRNHFSLQLFDTVMLRNYLMIGFRNVRKHKVFSAINIFGLGIALAACLLIFQFVSFELSYDKFNTKFDRIYRVTNDRFQNGKLIQHGTIMYPTIGPAMAKDFPEVEAYTRIMPAGELNIKVRDRIFRGEDCIFADEHFLSVFTFPMLAGERSSALRDRYTIVLTETTAKKYFDDAADNLSGIVGRVLYWGTDPQPYTVTGVCSDIPENSHLQFDALVSYSTLVSPENHGADDSWTWSDMRHYLVLKPGADYKALEGKFDDFSERYFKGDKVSGSVEKFFLQPLKDAHLYSDYEYDIAKVASGKAVWAMLIVAGFILLIAWVNYINLTTSRALERAKEVGLRKVMGAVRTQLVKQFIFESIIISLFAWITALIVVQASQSSFNEITRSNLSWWKVLTHLEPATLWIAVLVMVGGVVMSGFYPAWILSSYQPVTVLKGKFLRSSRGNLLRKALVVFQFTASAALITGTIVVSKQLKFMSSSDLGINIQNTVIIDSPERTAWDSTFITRVESFKHALSQINGVVNSTTSNNIPGARLGRAFNVHVMDQASSTNYTMSFMGVDYTFMDTYSIPLVAGRKFVSTDHHAEWDAISSLILNVNAVRLLGIASPEEAIGKSVSFWDKSWTVVGVVADFHQQALKNPMEPMLFFPAYSTYAPTSVRIRGAATQEIVAEIEKVYQQFFPDNAFGYSFLEDRYNRQYRDDNRFGQVVTIFTVLAIIIACLGLIGLSAYTAVQRTKEIGIRKALGATLFSIVSLLSMDFMKLIGIAVIVAIPIAYFAMQNWLEAYAYKISLGWILFAVPAIVILFIAAITMSFQIIKTARTNPVDTLKYE